MAVAALAIPLFALLPLATPLGCKEAPPAQVAQERKISLVEVLPGDLEVLTRATGGDGVQLSARVTYADGEVVDATDLVEWSSSNETAGTIDATGWFEPSTDNGGVTWVMARFAGVEGQVTITVRYQDDRVEGDADAGVFDGVSGFEPVEAWLYPQDGVNLPRNTPSIEFQWAAPTSLSSTGSDTGAAETGTADSGGTDTGGGTDTALGPMTWRLHFVSELTDVSVYTTEQVWTADEETWLGIASTNAGGTVTVELFGTDGTTAVQAETLEIKVSRFDARGSIVYWSTSAAGFMQVPYGEAAESFLAYEETGHCMGCHAVSRTGYIAFTYAGGDGQLGVNKMDDRSEVIPFGEGANANFKTWSPDGSRLISTYQGTLTLWDTATWESLGTIPLDATATHVDWSPDGTQVAMVLTDEHTWDWSFTGGKIAVLPVLGDDTFGVPMILYEADPGVNAYYPAFSPDGDWIAFNTSTGDSYDDLDADVHVISSNGGDVYTLDAANLAPEMTNSWPRWGPLPDDDILWLTFSSKRAYGTHSTDKPQIWVTAFDPNAAASGADPSYPAFWLPNQDFDQSNHIPVWTE